ncbi:MAG: GumC family protein [Phycisphaeraceae bacterium]
MQPDRRIPQGGATPPGGGRFKPIDPLRVLRRHVWLLMALVVLGVVAGGATWYAMRQYSPRYTSEAILRVDPRNVQAGTGLSSDVGGLPMELVIAAKRNEIALLMSEEVLREAVNRPAVRETRWLGPFSRTSGDGERSVNVQAAVDALQRGVLHASAETRSNVLPVTASTPNPDDAPRILQAVLDVYLSKVRTEREGESRNLRELYRTERNDAEQQIEQLRGRIREFEQRTDMSRLQAALDETVTTFQDRTEERNDLQMALYQARQNLESLKAAQREGTVEPDAAAAQEIESRPSIQELDRELRRMRRDKQSLLTDFGPNHRRVQKIDDRIEATQSQREAEFERLARERQAAQLERTAETVTKIEHRLNQIDTDLEELSQRRSDLRDQLRARESEYQALQEQLAQAKRNRDRAQNWLDQVNVQSRHPGAVTVDLRTRPSTPRLTSPKKGVIVPAVAMLVIGVGVGLLFLRETLDQRIKSPADMQLIAEANLLGVLPEATDDPSGSGEIEGAVRRQPTGLIAEAFRQVRTAALGKMERRGYRTLLISGAQPGSGTSSVAHNLACSLAYHGRDVLLIDTNLRRPAQHKLNDVAPNPGLVELLQHKSTIEQAVVKLEGMSLSVLPIGDAHAAAPELLAGSGLRSLLGELESRHDMIVIDAPPALLTSDTQLLARHVDAIVLVVRAERDKRGMIERMLRQLTGQRTEVLGLVLNAARSSAGGYFRESYREFYRYSNGMASRNGHAAKRGPQRVITPGKKQDDLESKRRAREAESPN